MTASTLREPGGSIGKYLISGSAWVLTGRLAKGAFVAVGNAFLARLLLPEGYGTFLLVFSLVSSAAVFGTLGLNLTATRLIAVSVSTDQAKKAGGVVVTVLRLGALSSLIVAGVLASGVGRWIGEEVFDFPLAAAAFRFAAIWVAVFVFRNIVVGIFRGFRDMLRATLFDGTITRLTTALFFGTVWVFWGALHLTQALVLAVLAESLSLLFAFVALWARARDLLGGRHLTLKEVLPITLPIALSDSLSTVLASVSLWVLGAARSAEEVALYGSALQLIILVGLPLKIVNAVVPPLIASLYAQEERKRLEETLRTVATVGGFPAFIALLAFIVFGGTILGLFYGDFYRQAAPILLVLSLGQVVNVWAGSCGMALMMTGHQTSVLRILTLKGFFLVMASLLVVQDHGAMGIAVVSAIGLVLQNSLMLVAAKRKIGVWTQASLSPKMLRRVTNVHLLRTYVGRN
jgi:O-antigen/teichoic acid export membrane protein